MVRKKWTAQEKVDEALIELREIRKWQIALRRYVIEKNKSTRYAPYFGLDVNGFREWIEVQFYDDLAWDSFGKAWQLSHIVPITYFDFSAEADLQLCWNFINIQVQSIDQTKKKINRIDVLAAKAFFEDLFKKTGYPICKKMVEKIKQIEKVQLSNEEKLLSFILNNQEKIEILSAFSVADFERLNTGTDLKVILAEKEFLKKWGS